MIDKIHGCYHLICDICEEEAEYDFGNFDEAVDYKTGHGWHTQRDSIETDEWIDICPDCREQ